MLILSQNKDTIINFERINYIEITKKDDHSYSIYLNYADSDWKNIGYYRTEDRAKEVLQEIIKCYRSYLQLNGGPAILQGQMDIQPNIFNIPKVYEMPEK